MDRVLGVTLVVAIGLLFGIPQRASSQTCTQTISPGTNLATAISGAPAGSTICLNSGSYGSVSVSNVVKSPRVTIRSVTAQGASFSLTTSNGTNGLTFAGMTIAGWDHSGATTKNITIQNAKFTSAAYLNVTGHVNNNIVIDNCSFINLNYRTGEGRLHITWPNGPGTQPVGVTVTNSLFENLPPYNVGESDGIQVGAYGVVIGPGNIFRGIHQGNFSAHVDAIQGYGQSHTVIIGNYFINNEVNIGFYDGGDTETVTNNVIVRGPDGIFHPNNVFLSAGPNATVTHNTFKDVNVAHGAKAGDQPNSNWLLQDNIFVNSDLGIYTGGGNGGCIGCVYKNNLFDAASTSLGTRVLGSPTFVGGSNPSTWQGYQLTSTSLGFHAAASPAGSDIGATVSGSASGIPPAAPTELTIE